MVRIFIVLVMFTSFVYGNAYEKNCLDCHSKLPVSIDKYFYNYLLRYSSEGDVKEAMITYLKSSSIKQKSLLSDKHRREAVNIYWEKYKVFGKLK